MGNESLKKSRIGACCKDCSDRHLACHDHCEKYKAAVKEWNEFKDIVRQNKKPSEHDLYRMESIKAMRKRRKWHDGKN